MHASSRLLATLWLLVAFAQQPGFAQVHSGDPFRALESSVGLERSAAALELGKVRDVRAIPRLASMAQHDPNVSVRMAATQALANIGGPDVVEPLIAVLKQQNAEIRGIAVEGLVVPASVSNGFVSPGL